MKNKLLCLAIAGLISTGTALDLRAGATAPNSASDARATSAELAGKHSHQVGMPDPADYSGLSRKVLQYSQAFAEITTQAKESELIETDWAQLGQLVDTENFERMGVFLGDEAEVINWQQYKKHISQYATHISWDGRLRRITETPGLVILELEEHNTVNGVTDISNTVTIYEFNDAGKIDHLDVYVMPLP